ncbi:MAG: Hsp70 family protein, partial [Coriobacteriia bacterium]
MSAVVGIDLGTTNTVVAAVQGGRAMALATESGDRLIPSVVSFHPNGSVVVGKDAKVRRLQDAANTIYSTKRLIGRSFDSEEVKKARARAAFQIQEGPGHGVLVVARGESFTLSEVSAFILKEAKRVAEAALGESVDRAVVTVPANFNDLQRAATKVAGHIAGVEVLRILNEPTAAALAYGYGKGNQERIVVYDFGGGTFDVTLLDLAGNVFEVLATSGDTFLGGDDIDLAIAERMADRYLQTHRYDPRSDRQVFERLLSAAEEIKVKLSASETATVQLQEVAYGPGGKAMDMPFSMTRQELDEVAAPYIDRTIRVCQDALGLARLQPDAFDQVIVVGGSTRIPSVRKKVAEFFGRKPLERLSADEVVALGAAIQASALAGAERKRGNTVQMKSRHKVTDPGLGSGRGRGIGMVAAPLSGPSPVTQPQAQGEDDDTAVMHRDDLKSAARGVPPTPPPTGRAKPPPPVRGRMQSDPDGPTLASEREKKRSGTAPGLFPGPDPGAVPLPLIEPGDRSSPSGLRVVDEDPTELRSATQLLREMESTGDYPIAGDKGSTTASMASAPRQPPPATTGMTTARTPSAPPLPPPSGPTGMTTARMPSAPPLPPPLVPPARGPRGTVIQGTRDPSPSVAAIGAAAAAATGAVSAALGSSGASPSPHTPFGAPPPPAVPPLDFKPSAPAVPVAAQKPAARKEDRTAPLLVDVTPLSLAVETVGGYCDVVIERNTPVPCERTRLFATAADNQSLVRVAVAQGESKRFAENALLGQLELSGLRSAVRGEVAVAVTFEIDSDGI